MNLTAGIRERVRSWVPLEDLLPDRLPAFVRSSAYFFGVSSLSSLVILILSGIILDDNSNIDVWVVVHMSMTARSRL